METEKQSTSDWRELHKFREFLETEPLYKKKTFVLPDGFHKMIPPVLKLYCRTDKAIETFRDLETRNNVRVQDDERKATEADRIRRINAQSVPRLNSTGGGPAFVPLAAPQGIYTLHYGCSTCQHDFFKCWVEVSQDKKWIQKVGQYPPWRIPISHDVEKRLGETDTELLKHSIACLGESYGIGACIYLRRVLENQIDQLLKIHLETRTEQKAPPQELEYIQRVINTVVTEEKIKLVSKTAVALIPTFANNPITKTMAN